MTMEIFAEEEGRADRGHNSPRTEDFVPEHVGPGVLPHWENCLDIAVTAAITWKFRLDFR